MKLVPTILSAAIAIIGAGAGCARTPAPTTGTAGPKPIVTSRRKADAFAESQDFQGLLRASRRKESPWKERKTFPSGMHAKRRQIILSRTRSAGRF